MQKFAWVMLLMALAWGGQRIWERNTDPPAPVAIEQPVAPPVVVEAPEPAPLAPPIAKARPQRPVAKTPRPKARPKAKNQPAPAPGPATAPRSAPRTSGHDQQFPRGAETGASTLPVSCATIRWYYKHARAVGESLAEQYHPTAAQIAEAKACLRG